MTESFKRYLADSRDPFNSAVLVFPLFVIYQLGLLATGGVRNGVDFITDALMAAAGGDFWTYFLINAGIGIAFGIGVFLLRHKGIFRPKIWPWVIGESTLYALFLGSAILLIMQTLGLSGLMASTFAQGPDLASGAAERGIFDSFVLSLGAGFYEELVFRVGLMGGLFWASLKAFEWPKWLAALVAVVVSSLIFSAIHHIGALGDPFTMGVFIYRFIAGAIFAAIFYLRGFAVAVYTHAIYDIYVMIFQA